jgi:hypothetical protein
METIDGYEKEREGKKMIGMLYIVTAGLAYIMFSGSKFQAYILFFLMFHWSSKKIKRKEKFFSFSFCGQLTTGITSKNKKTKKYMIGCVMCKEKEKEEKNFIRQYSIYYFDWPKTTKNHQ